MSEPCPVCRDRKTVRLPLWRSVSVELGPEPMPPSYEETSREYPCPACSDMLPVQRLSVATMGKEGLPMFDDEQQIKVMQRSMVHALADKIVRDGAVVFKRRRSEAPIPMFEYTGTIAIVMPQHVATMQERIAERQFEVAETVIGETRAEIRNWASFYHGHDGGMVDKAQAIDWMFAALRRVKAKYGKA